MRIDESLELRVDDHVFTTPAGPKATKAISTNGLAAFGHVECVLFVETAGYSEALLAEVGSLFRAIREQAIAGRTVRDGQWTTLSGPMATMPWAVGFAWLAAPAPFTGKLAGVAITQEELLVLIRRGSTRILSRLGAKARFYPTAWWAHRRNSVARAQDLEGPLQGIPAGHGAGASVTNGATGVEIYPGADLPALLAHLPADAAFIVPCTYADSDAMLFYEAGQEEPAAITRGTEPPARFGGAYFVLASSDIHGVQIIEDGFAVMLEPSVYDVAYKALREGTACAIHAGTVPVQIRAAL